MLTPERVDLHLPTSWNSCTVRELETIAGVLADRAMCTNDYAPFDIMEVKVALFFLLAELQVVEPVNPRIPVEEQYYTCKRTYATEGLLARILRWAKGDELEPFDVPLQAIYGWIMSELNWLDSKVGLTIFPYDKLRLRHGLRWVTFQAPSVLMQDFTWQRYRFAHDYLEYYTMQNNRAMEMVRKSHKYNPCEIKKQLLIADQARASFLATLFTCRIRKVDERTKQIRREYAYESNQHIDNAEFFRNFDPLKWQVILFWWQGMMYELQRRYPKCFKKTNLKPQKGKDGKIIQPKSSDPMELYTSTTSVLEKYLSWDENKVNNENFHTILKHMDNIAKENEEAEKMRNNK